MTRDEILEYPYQGVVTRLIEGRGDDDDTTKVIYEGVMDAHMMTYEEGKTLQTSTYIISMPLTKDDSDRYIVPRANDRIRVERYGETIELTVENAEPSQLGGISIYCTRKSWD